MQYSLQEDQILLLYKFILDLCLHDIRIMSVTQNKFFSSWGLKLWDFVIAPEQK